MSEEDLKSDIAALRQQIAGLEWLLAVMLVACIPQNTAAAEEYEVIVSIVRSFVKTAEGEQAAKPVEKILNEMKLFLAHNETDPVVLMAANSLRSLSLETKKRRALKSLLSQGRIPEFAEELGRLTGYVPPL